MSKIVPVLYKERKFNVAAPDIPVGGITPELMLKQDAVRQQQISNDQTRISQSMDAYAGMMIEKRKQAREVGKTVLEQLSETYDLEGLTAGSAAYKDALEKNILATFNSISSGYDVTEATNALNSKIGSEYGKHKTDEAAVSALVKQLEEKNKEDDTLYQYDIAKISGDIISGRLDINDVTGSLLMQDYRSADYSAIADQVRKECIEGKISGVSDLADTTTIDYRQYDGQGVLVTTEGGKKQILYDDCPQHFIALAGNAFKTDLRNAYGSQWDKMTELQRNENLGYYAKSVFDNFFGKNDYEHNSGLTTRQDVELKTLTRKPVGGGPGGPTDMRISTQGNIITADDLAWLTTVSDNEEAFSARQVWGLGIGLDADTADGVLTELSGMEWGFVEGSDEDNLTNAKNLGIDTKGGFRAGITASVLMSPVMALAGELNYPTAVNKNTAAVRDRAKKIEEIIVNNNNASQAADQLIEYIKSDELLLKKYGEQYPTGWEKAVRISLVGGGGHQTMKAIFTDTRRINEQSINRILSESENKDLREKVMKDFNENYSILTLPEGLHDALYSADQTTGWSVTPNAANGKFSKKKMLNSSAQYFTAMYVGNLRYDQVDQIVRSGKYNDLVKDKNNPGNWTLLNGTPYNPFAVNPLTLHSREPQEHINQDKYFDLKEMSESLIKSYGQGDVEASNDVQKMSMNITEEEMIESQNQQ